MRIGLSLGINNPILRTTIGGVTPPLDTYTGAQTAWSVARQLRTAYSGSLIRVRRDSDNAEQDIGFDGNGNLDESALTSFVGANSGYVTTAYDQSGNGYDWTQTTAASQPRIVDTGTVEKVNGKPCANQQDSTTIYLDSDDIGTSATATNFIVYKNEKTTITNGITAQTNTNIFWLSGLAGHIATSYLGVGTPSRYINSSFVAGTTRDDINTADYNIQVVASLINLDLSIASLSTLRTARVGAFRGKTKLQEFILYHSDKSSDRAAIETNINDYYGIY